MREPHMNYANIVRPSEMKMAKDWIGLMIERLCSMEVEKPCVEIKYVKQGCGKLGINCSFEKRPLCLNGKIHISGLGTHVDSIIKIKLPGPGSRLIGLAGVDDNSYTRANVKALEFSVTLGDGKQVWSSEPQTVSMEPAVVDVDLCGANEFELKVHGELRGGHADWADMRVILKDGLLLQIGDLPRESRYFSFRYDGNQSTQFINSWKLLENAPSPRGDFTLHRLSRIDPITGLKMTIDIKEYTEFPVVEWMLHLKNTSNVETPIIESIYPLDIELPPYAILNYHTGDYCAPDGYEPYQVLLAPSTEFKFAPDGGRPTDRAWPYYNLEYPETKQGVIIVVGWAGQWASNFHGGCDSISVRAGQELTHFKLNPGEEIRTPLSVLLFWSGEKMRSHNIWRRWMMACNMPKIEGHLPKPMLPAYTGRWFDEMATATTKTQIAFMDRYIEEGINLDYWWMDAGWYPCNGDWWNTGTWEPDSRRFPKGLREISDHARKMNIKTLVWFEPERVTSGTWLSRNHQEWLLEGTLLNLGNPDAFKWLIEHVSKLIVEQGIDLYRQDFNIPPLSYWRKADSPDRQGITEIRYVEGYLAFWKELRRRFPDMLIDSCASGGRRNDLETMRLSIPLHKTDYKYDDLTAKQAFHHSLALWFPYFGAYVLPVDEVDTYAFRSSIAPMTMLTYDLRRRDLDWKKLKNLTEEWRQAVDAGYFYGDYYPLTEYSRTEDQWIAWQFHRPDKGSGILQAFRRKDSPFESARCKLHGLDSNETYLVTNMDKPGTIEKFRGKDLMESGMPVRMPYAPQATLILYRRET